MFATCPLGGAFFAAFFIRNGCTGQNHYGRGFFFFFFFFFFSTSSSKPSRRFPTIPRSDATSSGDGIGVVIFTEWLIWVL
jgi:hypothetical protein